MFSLPDHIRFHSVKHISRKKEYVQQLHDAQYPPKKSFMQCLRMDEIRPAVRFQPRQDSFFFHIHFLDDFGVSLLSSN
jgi:hypothetical protein